MTEGGRQGRSGEVTGRGTPANNNQNDDDDDGDDDEDDYSSMI